MNPARPDRPQDQPHDKDLSQLYRDAARAEPPAALDRQIIAAAQAEAAQAFSSQVREVADRLFEQVNSISFGTLGGVGLVMLLWSVVGTLGKVLERLAVVTPRARSLPDSMCGRAEVMLSNM